MARESLYAETECDKIGFKTKTTFQMDIFLWIKKLVSCAMLTLNIRNF